MNNTSRIAAIDILRGLVMIIMALDHTRDFFHITAFTDDPLNPQTTSAALYFTRWITHFCAPTFILLSGVSAYLSAQKKTPAQASIFLIKRGLWLVLVEILIINLGMSFNPSYNFLILQVIWAIGWSMILLGLVSRIGYKAVLFTGILLFFGHNIANYLSLPQEGLTAALWKILVTSGYVWQPTSSHGAGFFYAILPWTGVMFMGYAIGKCYTGDFGASRRRRLLFFSGLALFIAALVLRYFGSYGDPAPARDYHTALQDVFSFFKVSKYPPSLQYLGLTLGPVLMLLPALERVQAGWSRVVLVYGKVPFFYYVLHFYLIHLLTVIVFFASGYGIKDIADPQSPFLFRPQHFGFSLPVVYLVWILVVALLYLPCRWFMRYKATHKQWWLSYL